MIAYDKKKERVIYETKAKRQPFGFIGLTEDDQFLVLSAYSSDTGYRSFFKMSLATGEISDAGLNRAGADIGWFFQDLHQYVYGTQYSGLIPSYQFYDADVDARVSNILSALPDHTVQIVDHTPDWKKIIVYVEGSTSAGDYYLVDDNEEVIRKLSEVH